MYQGGGSVMSRCGGAKDEKQKTKAPRPFFRSEAPGKAYLRNKTQLATLEAIADFAGSSIASALIVFMLVVSSS
jgi:hypothetical protein